MSKSCSDRSVLRQLKIKIKMIKHIDIFSIYWYYNLAVRECWNWQTGKTKDLVGVCSCGFKSHLPHTEKRAESFDFIQVFCFFYCLNDTIFVSRCLTFLGGVATISCGGCRADKTSWSFCSVLVRVKM